MRRPPLFILIVLVCMLATGAAWLIHDASRPRTPEEEVCSAAINLAIEGIHSRDDYVLIEFRGAAITSDSTVRRRILHAASPGNLHLIDIYPRHLEGSFRDPITGNHAHELLIKIEEWRSPSEVVVSILLTSAPLAGGGGKFVMIKSGGLWVVKETIETVRV